MSDLRSPRLMYAKAVLLLLAGSVAAGLIMAERPTLRTAALLAIAIWAFARAYYFAFYVVERYVDPQFRFSGLRAFAWYLVTKRAGRSR